MTIDHPAKSFGLGMFKLLLFGAELFLLVVFCNGLFLVPEPYLGRRGFYIVISAIAAAGFALASGKISLISPAHNKSPSRKIFTTFPVVFYVVILSLAILIFLLALLGMK